MIFKIKKFKILDSKILDRHVTQFWEKILFARSREVEMSYLNCQPQKNKLGTSKSKIWIHSRFIQPPFVTPKILEFWIVEQKIVIFGHEKEFGSGVNPGKLIHQKIMSNSFKQTGRELDRFTGKLIQSSIGKFWGVTQVVLIKYLNIKLCIIYCV